MIETSEKAEIFHRLKLIESYGTGIRKIYALYKNCAVQPRIEVTENTFKMILPNMNTSEKAEKGGKTEKESGVITPQMKIVLNYLDEYGKMTEEELRELLNIKKTRAYVLTRQMQEEWLLEIAGRGEGKKYRIPGKSC